MQRAIASDPKNAEAQHLYGWTLARLGDDSGAVLAFRRALALDPERTITLSLIGVVYLDEGRYAAARPWLDSALALDPGFHMPYVWRAAVRSNLGDTAGARADAETAVRLAKGDKWRGEAMIAYVDAQAGDTAAARARIERILRDDVALAGAEQPSTGFVLGMLLTMVEQHERALDLLERVRPRGAEFWFYLRAKELDVLRSNPRFQRLVEESKPY